MKFKNEQYISPDLLYWRGVIQDFPKSRSALQPIFEAFTNSLEAIKIKQKTSSDLVGDIKIIINASETTIANNFNFDSLTIIDNGIGFNDEQFTRFNRFKDTTKGYKNLGSGRIQYAHYFDKTTVNSVFEDDDKTYEREFYVSKTKKYLDNNSIVFHKKCEEISKRESGTTIKFEMLLDNSALYNKLDAKSLKEQLVRRYIHTFSLNKNNLPNIEIKYKVQGSLIDNVKIETTDLPDIEKTEILKINYKKLSDNGLSIEEIGKTEDFKIDAIRLKEDLIEHNDLKLVSKGEIVEESDVKLESLPKGENIKGYKYIFLISSNYIDDRDTDIRGVLKIPTVDSLTKNTSLFVQEEITIEDIQNGVNEKINTMYPEIDKVKQEHILEIDKLKEMFFLDDESLKDLKISINDTEVKILEKVYESEAKKTAQLDASIKQSVDNLEKLDTTSPNYLDELKKEVEKLVKAIPIQNKKTLTHYIARRRLVIDLFEKVLNKKLDVQKAGRNYDEELIHDLLFQQGSNDAESIDSDLWIINEDFIYFKGNSNVALNQIEVDGEKLFKSDFKVEEEKYLRSLGENRKLKKPDVLLFPGEGKCIIIEFKAPDVNVSDHLTQIDKYAGLIRNYTNDNVQINTFYGYLLGESIENRDVLGAVSSYEESYQFDYLFRPSTKVIGFDDRTNGSIYTEVIKYSTLLERARQRNDIFMKKLNIDHIK